MTESERIAELERQVAFLMDALARQGFTLMTVTQVLNTDALPGERSLKPQRSRVKAH